jgi:ferredoxin-type protein NapH
MLLFIGAMLWKWRILVGNLSAAYVLDTFYLSDPFALLQMLLAGFVITKDVLIGALIVLFFYALVTGRVFCSWICPMNLISDFTNFVYRKLHLGRENKKFNFPNYARYIVLGLALILSFIFEFAAFELISPISVLHRSIIFGIGTSTLIVVAVILADLFIQPRLWCSYLCPLGGMYAATSRFRLLKVWHTKDNCTECMKCKVVCPERQILKIINVEDGFITSGACTNCGRCIEVCEDNALNFSLNPFKPNRDEP